MSSSNSINVSWVLIGILFRIAVGREDIWINVPCNKEFKPADCNFNSTGFFSIEELDRCAPARLTIKTRNYFLGASGRKTTYKDNKDAFDRIRVQPKMMNDVSQNSVDTSILGGIKVDFPVGLSPVALQRLASENGELDTIRGLSGIRTVMMLSSFASTRVEDVAAAAWEGLQLWQQVHIFDDRSVTEDLVWRAEGAGVKAIVLTVDTPEEIAVSCNARVEVQIPDNIPLNLPWHTQYDLAANFKDITWLTTITKLPIIVKGILTGRDALTAVEAGASGIVVSNHGGRQMDGALASIDALPSVVRAMRGLHPPIDVYLDGGVRSGHDVFKAIAKGAKMVFVGRPQIWAIAVGGSQGIGKMMAIFKNQFNETMITAGARNVASVGSDFLVQAYKPAIPCGESEPTGD